LERQSLLAHHAYELKIRQQFFSCLEVTVAFETLKDFCQDKSANDDDFFAESSI
jgi:hypothetical protein